MAPSEKDTMTTALFTGSRITAAVDAATAVAHLRLTRADARNAIDREFVTDLHAAVDAVHAHAAEARALLISADGPAFSVGGDLQHFYGRLDRLADELVYMVGNFHETLATVAELPMPVVCAVQGAVAGGGLGLLWASDIVIAADDLKLTTAFARLGVSGDGGGSWYLTQLVGLRSALALTLESPTLDAAHALDYRLVTRVVAAQGLAEEAERTALRLAAGPTRSMGLQRRLIRQACNRGMRDGLTAEVDAMRICGNTLDAREGMAAFAEKRTPIFTNR